MLKRERSGVKTCENGTTGDDAPYGHTSSNHPAVVGTVLLQAPGLAPAIVRSTITRIQGFMSCLSKVGCLTVVVIVGAGAWWAYGGDVPTFFARGGRISMPATTASDTSRKRIAWATMNEAQTPPADAIAALERPNGPAYITLGAGDLAGFLADGFGRVLPQSAKGVQVAIVDDVVRVRAEIPLRALGGKALPEFVSDLLSARDTVEMAGSLEMLHAGLAQFRVREVIVRGIPLPPRVVPALLSALRKSAPQRESVASDAVALQLPKSVSDIRVSRGRVTLYKSVSPSSK